MGIIERINTLREERRTLLTEADACEDMDRLHAIRDRLNAINSQMDDMEALRDHVGAPLYSRILGALDPVRMVGEDYRRRQALARRQAGGRTP